MAAEHLELPITGMTCASCANRIERKLNKLDGVTATVNYATEHATVDYDAGRGRARAAASRPSRRPATRAAAARRAAEAHAEPLDETAALRQRLLVSLALTLPVLLMAMIPPLQFDNWQWLSLTLAAPVVVWGAWPFHRAAWANLRTRTATMDTLISRRRARRVRRGRCTRCSSATPACPGMTMGFDLIPERGAGTDEIYLEVAAAVTVFILAGRYFEARAKRRAGAALTALLELGAKDVAVLDADGARAPRAGRAARRRRPLRRAPGREGRHRRRRRGRHLRRRPVAADRRVRAGREAARRRGRRRDASTPAAGSSCARRRSAPTPRSPRSRGSSPTRSPARRRCSGSPTASRASSCRS